jgi:hypothetical protein
MPKIRLKDVVEVKGRYHRSVQLARDWSERQDLSQYILTPTARQLAMRIVKSASSIGSPRAWSVTGPYGSGKSSLALFLADLLARRKPLHPEASALRRELALRGKEYLPVLIVGHRAPFAATLLSRLAESLEPIAPPVVEAIRTSLAEGRLDAGSVAELFERAAAAVQASGYAGLLVTVDEFGKHLEYAAMYPDSEDLLVLQHLAETAARSPVPIIFITILHTAFAEYARSTDESKQAEWQKVQGRFADVVFLEPPEQLLGLIRAALARQLPPALAAAYTQEIEGVLASPALAEAKQRFALDELLPSCAPLDPVTTLLLWPLFRSKLAQHERSLFGFLSSAEPFGFQEFLSLAEWDEAEPARPPFYRADRLYDYVSNALGAAVFRGDRARRWAEVDHALAKVGADAPPLARPVLKVIGLLGLYGPAVGLRASQDTLSIALGDEQAVKHAVDYLKAISSIVYRRHEGAYSLWEGSDVDLEALIEEGRQHTGQSSPASRLKRMVDLMPVVARAHYLETGTLRYFTTDVVDGTPDNLRETVAAQDTRGRITYVLAKSARDREALLSLGLELTSDLSGEQQLRILAFPRPIAGLEEALEDLEAWRWVSENTPALQGDPVARQEVKARIQYAQQRLEDIAGRALGLRGYPFDPAVTEWVQGGMLHAPQRAQEFLRWLSSLCDAVYSQAPPLHNELLNRDNLSSSATAARRNLLAVMVTGATQHRLGIEGTPAEVSMYEALLAAGGFHSERDGQWSFGAPCQDWQPVWEAITRFLQSTHAGRRKVTDLYAELKRAPYGLREGPIPVLLSAVLLTYRDDLALYEGGAFIPEPRIEVLERLTRQPSSFEVQHYALSAQDREVFEAIGLAVGDLTPSNGTNESPLLSLVKPLVLFAARLPGYTKHTRRLDPAALAVRDALLQARDPYKLLFSDLPAALGVDPEDPGANLKLSTALSETLHTLQRTYPALLDQIEEQVRLTFGLDGTYEEAREQLRQRAAPLLGYVADKTLLVFVREAARVDDRDWRETLGRVVQGGNPTVQWRDGEAAGFQVRLRQLKADFTRIEELVAELQKAPGTQIFRIGLLNGHVQEAREVVSMSQQSAPLIQNLSEQVSALLEQAGDQSVEAARRLRLAVLAHVAAKYLLVEPEYESDLQPEPIPEVPYER